MTQLNMSLTDTDASTSRDFFCVSTVDGLSYTPSAQERSRDAAQIAATGRRSWKTLKGTGEAVWPPQLEAALIEALEKYQLDDSWLSKSPGRFPMRNRFISDYIFHLTGKRRSPKQVGSRLQQLKDTCRGKRMLTLIASSSQSANSSTSDGRFKSISPTPSSSNTDSGHSDAVSTMSLEGASACREPVRPHSAIQVNILPECAPWQASLPVIDFRKSEVHNIRLTAFPLDSESSSLRWDTDDNSTPDLRSANPNVVFASPHVLYPQASFSVYRNGETEAIYSEYSQLLCHTSPNQESALLYTSTLVPGYWNILSRDPAAYTIRQDIFSIDDNGASIDSIHYTFIPSQNTRRPSQPSQFELVLLPPERSEESRDLRPITLPQSISLSRIPPTITNEPDASESLQPPPRISSSRYRPASIIYAVDSANHHDFSSSLVDAPQPHRGLLPMGERQTNLQIQNSSCNEGQQWPSDISTTPSYMTTCVRNNN